MLRVGLGSGPLSQSSDVVRISCIATVKKKKRGEETATRTLGCRGGDTPCGNGIKIKISAPLHTYQLLSTRCPSSPPLFIHFFRLTVRLSRAPSRCAEKKILVVDAVAGGDDDHTCMMAVIAITYHHHCILSHF